MRSTLRLPSSTISSNARLNRKSPTSTLAGLPQMRLAVRLPRRMLDPGEAIQRQRLDCFVATLLAMTRSRLPDVHPLLGRQIELVAGLHVERLIPGVDVPHDAVHPILARAVLVGDDLLPLGVLSLL